jgi:hypothetical protein
MLVSLKHLPHHDLLHNFKNAELKVWVSALGSMQLIAAQEGGLGFKGCLFQVARLHARVAKLARVALEHSCFELGLPKPLTVPGEVEHRLLIVTSLGEHVLWCLPAYEHMCWQVNEAYGGGRWLNKTGSSGDKVAHFRQVFHALHDPRVLLMSAVAARLHPSKCALYTLFNSKQGFVKINAAVYLQEYLQELQYTAAHLPDLLHGMVGTGMLRARFGVPQDAVRQVINDAAAAAAKDRAAELQQEQERKQKEQQQQPSSGGDTAAAAAATSSEDMQGQRQQQPLRQQGQQRQQPQHPWGDDSGNEQQEQQLVNLLELELQYARQQQQQQQQQQQRSTRCSAGPPNLRSPPVAPQPPQQVLWELGVKGVLTEELHAAALQQLDTTAQPQFEWWRLPEQHRDDYVLSFFTDRDYAITLSQVAGGLLAEAAYLKEEAAPYLSHLAAQTAACWHPGPEGVVRLQRLLHMCSLHHQHGHRCVSCVAYAAAPAWQRRLQQQQGQGQQQAQEQQGQQQPQRLPLPCFPASHQPAKALLQLPPGLSTASSIPHELYVWQECSADTAKPVIFLWVENGAVPADTNCQAAMAKAWRAGFWRQLLGSDFQQRLSSGAGQLWQLSLEEALS